MIKTLRYYAKTDLIRTSFFTALSTFVKIATGFVLNKVVAGFLGPAGIAMLGQFVNFLGITSVISGGGIDNGVIKYTSQHRNDNTRLRAIISTSFFIIILFSGITSLVVLSLSSYFSELIFKSQEYKFTIIFTALSLLFISLKSLFINILNGHKEVAKITWINIITSLLTLALSLYAVSIYKLQGLLLALIMCQALAFFISLLFSLKSQWFKIDYFLHSFDIRVLKNLSGFSFMTLITSFSGPLSLIFVRLYIQNHLSWQETGYWQGAWSISEGYLMFISSTLNIYYLPKMSELTDNKDIRKELINTGRIFLPIVSVTLLVVFLLKSPLVNILFTSEFKPVLPLLKYQLLGDFFRIAGWLFTLQMISKAMTKLFIFTEIFFNLSFMGLSVVLINYIGTTGASLSFLVNCVFYLIFMLFAFRKMLFIKSR